MADRRATLAELEQLGRAKGEAAGRILVENVAALDAREEALGAEMLDAVIDELAVFETSLRQVGVEQHEIAAWRSGASAGLRLTLERARLTVAASGVAN